MFGYVLILALIVAHQKVTASFRQGYIMDVSPGCGATSSDDATITIRTDMDVSAKALCNNSNSAANQLFATTQNGVVLTRVVKTTGASASECQFTKKDNSNTFTMVIKVSYGEPGSFVHTKSEQYLITCTYDDNGVNIAESSSRSITDFYLQPQEIQSNKGSPTSSTITLDTVDVLGASLSGSDYPIGKKVALSATIFFAAPGTGLQAVSCRAYNPTTSYSILRGGCGDGVIFPKDQGFITYGDTAVSPYFGAFELHDGSTIQFECNFTTCPIGCDGDSCSASLIRKRSVKDGGILESVQVSSPKLDIESDKCYKYGKKLDKKTKLVLLAPGFSTKPLTEAKLDGEKTNYNMTPTFMLMIAAVAITMTVCIAGVIFMTVRQMRRQTMVQH